MTHTHGPVPGSERNEIVKSMIKLETIVEPASAILTVFLYAFKTKRPDSNLAQAFQVPRCGHHTTSLLNLKLCWLCRITGWECASELYPPTIDAVADELNRTDRVQGECSSGLYAVVVLDPVMQHQLANEKKSLDYTR